LTDARKMRTTGPHPGWFWSRTAADVSWITSKSSHIGEFDMISIVEDLAAEALFVSDLQPSQQPGRGAVEGAVTAMILRYGSDGCAAGVASEFGDHPDAAVCRMAWVRTSLRDVAGQRRPHFAS
jgi:hypothetical protein